MSTFTYDVDYAANKTVRPQVRSVKFGDGYEQRLTWGMNQAPETWQLSFNYRDEAEANAIEDFFIARAGTEPFDWTPPDATESKRFLAREWSKTIQRGNLWDISVTFEECFDP